MINTMITAHISPCRSGLLAAIRAGDGAPTPVDMPVGAASRRDSRRRRCSHTSRQTCGSGVSPRIAAGDGALAGKHRVSGET